jgi:hypothetical protein
MNAAADVIERVALAQTSDPSTDDLTVPLAIECAEKDAIIKRLYSELESLRASKEQLRSALADMVVEYVTARKEGNVAGLPATAQAIVRRAEACFEPNTP